MGAPHGFARQLSKNGIPKLVAEAGQRDVSCSAAADWELVADEPAAAAGEDGRSAFEARPLLLVAALAQESFDSTTLRSHAGPDFGPILSGGVDHDRQQKTWGASRGNGKVEVPVGRIRKAHRRLPDGALAPGLQTCACERARGCILLHAWDAKAQIPGYSHS